MDRSELQDRLRVALTVLYSVTDKLTAVRDSPEWDEDYKVERDARLTRQLFVQLQEVADVLAGVASRLP